MPRNEISVLVSAETKNAQQNLKSLNQEGQKLGDSFKKIALRAGVVGGAITGVGIVAQSLVSTYLTQQKAEAQLAQVVSNTGAEYAAVETQIKSLTAALQAKTNFGDEAQIQALSRMTVILGDVEKAQAALPAVLDAATVSGSDLQTVAGTLSKALAGQAEQAESVGIKFDKAAGFAERLAEVQEKVGGSAEASADPFVQLGNAMGDFQETLGGLLAGPLTQAVEGLTAVVNKFSELIEFLAASNTMWDENGKRIKPVTRSIEEMNAALADKLIPSTFQMVEVGNGFVQFLNEEEVALRELQSVLNNYNISSEQVAAINRENFDTQQRLIAIERERTEQLAKLAEEQAKAAREAEEAQLDALTKQLEDEAKAYLALTKAQRDAALEARKLNREERLRKAQVKQNTEALAAEVSALSTELQDNARFTDEVTRIMANAEDGTIDWVEAQRLLKELLPVINDEIKTQTNSIKEQGKEWRNINAAIKEAAETQAEFFGRGPSALPVSQAFVTPTATQLFSSLDQSRLERLFQDFDMGDVNLESFIQFFQQTVQGFLSTSIDRTDALLRAVQQIQGFQTGGVVPGPMGSPRLILAHGGETVLPTHLSGGHGMGGITINFNGDINGGDEFRDELESIVEEALSRRGSAGARRRS